MDGRYAGLSRSSMASEALELLPVENAGAIPGQATGSPKRRSLSASRPQGHSHACPPKCGVAAGQAGDGEPVRDAADLRVQQKIF